MRNSSLVSKLLGVVCVILTGVLWSITIATDPTADAVGAAAALTAIVAIMIAFVMWE
jgi:hypothetical protein